MADFSKESFFNDLRNIGLHSHDTVLITVNMEKFGLIQGFRRSDYVNLFREFFDTGGGTFISLAFTPCKFSLLNRNLPYFDGTQSAETGAFPNAMLKDKNSFRSQHPTNSVVAIGRNAENFVSGLDEKTGAYAFCNRLVEADGKFLLIGMAEYPGFLTHLVEHELGLYKQYWSRFFLKVRLKNGVFVRLDPGGCSTTFGRLYPEYIKKEALRIGTINGAYSLSINARIAYQIDHEVVSADPDILICDNPDCSKCRIHRWKGMWRIPFFVLKKLIKKAKNH